MTTINCGKSEKAENTEQFQEDWNERTEYITKYRGYDEKKICSMDEEDLYEYIPPLWVIIKRK